MLYLYDFSTTSRSYAKSMLAGDEDLGRLLELLSDDAAGWVYDYDPLWREVIVFAAGDDAGSRLADALARSAVDAGPIQAGKLGVEAPTQPAEGVSRRSYERNKRMHTAEVVISLEPGEPGSGLLIDSFASDYAPVLVHGARRSARSGPAAHFPVTDARLSIRSAFAGESAPALADLHAAATHAASRAFQAAGTKAYLAPLDRTEQDGMAPFPDLETSAADTFANLLELFAYPVALLNEEERGQLGSFIAYQVSLLFGHQLDARMRRQPRQPPQVLQPLLGRLAGDLARRATADARPGAQMVLDLLRLWTEPWLAASLPCLDTGAAAAEQPRADEAPPDAGLAPVPEAAPAPAPVPVPEPPLATAAAAQGAALAPAPAPAYSLADDGAEDESGC